MRNDLINEVLDGGFFGWAELKATLPDPLDLIFQKLNEVAVLLSRHERYRAHETVPTLICLCKVIREFGESFVELLGRFVDGKGGRI